MSRTDNSKPVWVKLAHGDLMVVEARDHTAGPYDLPDPYDAFAFSRLTTRCRREFVYTGTETCCCRMCRIVIDYPDRTARHRRRRERRQARRQLRRDWAD